MWGSAQSRGHVLKPWRGKATSSSFKLLSLISSPQPAALVFQLAPCCAIFSMSSCLLQAQPAVRGQPGGPDLGGSQHELPPQPPGARFDVSQSAAAHPLASQGGPLQPSCSQNINPDAVTAGELASQAYHGPPDDEAGKICVSAT